MTRAQRNCDQLCVCVCVRHWKWTSYFLNCSWKRSLWPWRVSAGRPACTQRQVARNYLQTGRSGYFKTCLTAYTYGGIWLRILQNCKFPHLPFQRVRKRLFETELLVNFFFPVRLWKFSWARGVLRNPSIQRGETHLSIFEDNCQRF